MKDLICVKKWRVHLATRLIVAYAETRSTQWVYLSSWDFPCIPTFQHYKHSECQKKFLPFITALANHWPKDKLAFFDPRPAIHMLEKHSEAEQVEILNLLGAIYGFNGCQSESSKL